MDETYLVAVAFFGATFGCFSVETSCFSASRLGSRIFEEIHSLSGWMLVHGRGCARLQGVMSLTMPVNLLLQITGLPAWMRLELSPTWAIYVFSGCDDNKASGCFEGAALEGFSSALSNIFAFIVSHPDIHTIWSTPNGTVKPSVQLTAYAYRET
uniref:Uncharacterized protein n=1 Tax=Glossina pallidipes TaxID=7398 RepID=A0A1B0ACS1_GLOPL